MSAFSRGGTVEGSPSSALAKRELGWFFVINLLYDLRWVLCLVWLCFLTDIMSRWPFWSLLHLTSLTIILESKTRESNYWTLTVCSIDVAVIQLLYMQDELEASQEPSWMGPLISLMLPSNKQTQRGAANGLQTPIWAVIRARFEPEHASSWSPSLNPQVQTEELF